jgi:hypothetical protein
MMQRAKRSYERRDMDRYGSHASRIEEMGFDSTGACRAILTSTILNAVDGRSHTSCDERIVARLSQRCEAR